MRGDLQSELEMNAVGGAEWILLRLLHHSCILLCSGLTGAARAGQVLHIAILFEVADPMQTGARVTGDARRDVGEAALIQVERNNRPALSWAEVAVRGGAGREEGGRRRGRAEGRGRGRRGERRVLQLLVVSTGTCLASVCAVAALLGNDSTVAAVLLQQCNTMQQHRNGHSCG